MKNCEHGLKYEVLLTKQFKILRKQFVFNDFAD